MALDTLLSNDLTNFIIYDTISATPFSTTHDFSDTTSFLPENNSKVLNDQDPGGALDRRLQEKEAAAAVERRRQNLAAAQGRKKRRRRARVCKNKEEAEMQRMTHIAVERNRRKQMNEHLSVLRSLMPQSYVQRGDQASIVGGAIEFVKQLEHLLQTLEAQKLELLQQGILEDHHNEEDTTNSTTTTSKFMAPPFSQFFVYPQYTWSQIPNKYASKSKAAVADIEVNLIDTHANIRFLWRRSPRQLSKLVAGFHTLHLTVLHLSVTTMDHLVLYSISAKIEEGCQLISVDDIAGTVHHMLRIIEEEAVLCC